LPKHGQSGEDPAGSFMSVSFAEWCAAQRRKFDADLRHLRRGFRTASRYCFNEAMGLLPYVPEETPQPNGTILRRRGSCFGSN
jgi:hypothetical protein